MPTTLDQLSASLTPDTLNSLGSALGLDPSVVQQGMNVVGPLVQGGLASASSTPQGAEGLSSLLNQLPASMGDDPVSAITSALSGGGGLGGLLGGLLGGGAAAGGAAAASAGQIDIMGALMGGSSAGNPLSGIVNSAFGSGIDSIAKSLKGMLGFDVKPLLMAGIPLVLGLLKKQMSSSKMDSSGLASMLKQEADDFAKSGAPEAKMVADAMAVGKKASALRSSLSDEDLVALKAGALSAIGLVAAASGSKGAAAELDAGVKALTELAGSAAPASIIDVAYGEGFSDEEIKAYATSVSTQGVVAALSKANAVVKAKSSDDLAAFRTTITNAAEAAAKASKEGGFLGIGGKQVSDDEINALQMVSAALA
jgi:hypothetical protein